MKNKIFKSLTLLAISFFAFTSKAATFEIAQGYGCMPCVCTYTVYDAGGNVLAFYGTNNPAPSGTCFNGTPDHVTINVAGSGSITLNLNTNGVVYCNCMLPPANFTFSVASASSGTCTMMLIVNM